MCCAPAIQQCAAPPSRLLSQKVFWFSTRTIDVEVVFAEIRDAVFMELEI